MLAIKNVNISYTLPKSVLSYVNFKAARIGVGVENLAFFNARKGMNPQDSFSGAQYNSYVPARTVTATLNVSF
jgi:hypothetical protein